MAITLYGSLPSPYVRRIRILLDGVDYKFEQINVYEDSARAEYAKLTPIKKLPLLTDGEQSIFDSHIIAQYVFAKKQQAQPSVDVLNLVSAVDAVTDSLIILFMAKRSDIETSEDKLIFKLQLTRIPDCLTWLNEQAKQGKFESLNYATIALISLIDWAEFRQLYDFSDYPDLIKVRDTFADTEVVKQTYPQ